jgi:hypothetical protein
MYSLQVCYVLCYTKVGMGFLRLIGDQISPGTWFSCHPIISEPPTSKKFSLTPTRIQKWESPPFLQICKRVLSFNIFDSYKSSYQTLLFIIQLEKSFVQETFILYVWILIPSLWVGINHAIWVTCIPFLLIVLLEKKPRSIVLYFFKALFLASRKDSINTVRLNKTELQH